jgi:general secretion pathway protein I
VVQSGFTLLEVMVALMIVAIAFVGLLGVHNRNLRQVGRDQDVTRATLLARELVAQMEVSEKFPDTGVSNGEFEDQPGFFWQREVTDTDLPNIREVHLRIIFDERQPNAYELLYFARDRREPEDQ